MDESAAVAPAVQSILVAARERPGGTERVSVDARPLTDAFERALAGGRTPLIAEVKPTSPTTDGRRADDPVALAEAMVDGGAAALSVLTEPEHFGGSPEHLRRVREAVEVPVLRKDFVLTEAQLDTVAADLVLLIARFVDDLPALTAAAQERGFQVLIETHTRAEVEAAVEAGADVIGINNRDLAALEVAVVDPDHVGARLDCRVDLGACVGFDDLPALTAAAQERGFQVLIETHTRAEVEAAVEAGADVIGINNRDLAALEVDLGTFERVAPAVPSDATLIAESGIGTRADVERMRGAGADGLLVGSAIMDGDVTGNTRRLTGATEPTS